MPAENRGEGAGAGARFVQLVPSQVQVSPRDPVSLNPPNSTSWPWAASSAVPMWYRGEGAACAAASAGAETRTAIAPATETATSDATIRGLIIGSSSSAWGGAVVGSSA